MNVYKKHSKVTRLVAEYSPYELALMLVDTEAASDALAARVKAEVIREAAEHVGPGMVCSELMDHAQRLIDEAEGGE